MMTMKRKYVDPRNFEISEIINTSVLARGRIDLPSSLHMLVGKLSQVMNDILNDIYDEVETLSDEINELKKYHGNDTHDIDVSKLFSKKYP